MVAAFNSFLASPEGIAFWGLFVVSLADFGMSTFQALSKDTFKLDLVATWVRSHIWGRVAPISLLLLAGFFLAQPALTAIAALAATTYVLETIGSIKDSFQPNPELPEG
jgi:hypothetical protein